MAQVRKRYYIWLVKAYLKKWKRMIATSAVVGVLIFFVVFLLFSVYIKPTLQNKVQRIGYVGVYDTKSLPEDIMSDVSFGLTTINTNSTIASGAASSWQIEDGGKKYVFHLKKGLYFSNGQELTSENLPLNFQGVKRQDVNKYTVSYSLKEAFSPFLVSVAQPILLPDLSGLGKYMIQNMDVNGGFVRSLTLVNREDNSKKKIINFYPTYDALKTAFALGEVDIIKNVDSKTFDGRNFSNWRTAHVQKHVAYSQLVTIFYNNNDENLSNKKLREALNYALPPSFSEGKRAFSPISPLSIYFSKGPNYGITDDGIARDLFASADIPKGKVFTLTTTPQYFNVAQKVQKAWSKIGVQTNIEVVDSMPSNFQMFLQAFLIPQDPDQYTLWHSDQPDNISQFKSLRIDKLLEDGRSQTNINDRINTYADFQKYMLDEVPASFLYFPYEYTIYR